MENDLEFYNLQQEQPREKRLIKNGLKWDGQMLNTRGRVGGVLFPVTNHPKLV